MKVRFLPQSTERFKTIEHAEKKIYYITTEVTEDREV